MIPCNIRREVCSGGAAKHPTVARLQSPSTPPEPAPVRPRLPRAMDGGNKHDASRLTTGRLFWHRGAGTGTRRIAWTAGSVSEAVVVRHDPLYHARRALGIRRRLPTTERLFWRSRAHSTEPKIDFGPIRSIPPIAYYYQNMHMCCFLWHVVVAADAVGSLAPRPSPLAPRPSPLAPGGGRTGGGGLLAIMLFRVHLRARRRHQ